MGRAPAARDSEGPRAHCRRLPCPLQTPALPIAEACLAHCLRLSSHRHPRAAVTVHPDATGFALVRSNLSPDIPFGLPHHRCGLGWGGSARLALMLLLPLVPSAAAAAQRPLRPAPAMPHANMLGQHLFWALLSDLLRRCCVAPPPPAPPGLALSFSFLPSPAPPCPLGAATLWAR